MIYATGYKIVEGSHPVATTKSCDSGFQSLVDVRQVVGDNGLISDKHPRILRYQDVIFSDEIQFHIDDLGNTG